MTATSMDEMHTNTYPPKEAIGYVRVSTDMQAQSGRGLERQIQKLRIWCEANNFKLSAIYEDVASAVGDQKLRRRPDFEQAVRQAQLADVPLIVSDVSRLSRDLATLDRVVVSTGIKVISVLDDGEVPVGLLRERVGKAANDASRIAEGTREALSSFDRPQMTPELKGNRQRAAHESARTRVFKKFHVLDQVVDYLEVNPDLINETSNVIADRLNKAGILTGWNKAWTSSAVRGKLTAIKEELAFRREMDAEDAEDEYGDISGESTQSSSFPAVGDDTLGPRVSEKSVNASTSETSDGDAEASDEELEYAELKRNPLFGMF